MEDILILKVGVKTVPGNFAGAIKRYLAENKPVRARAFGQSALHILVKGLALAQEYADKEDLGLINVNFKMETLDNPGFEKIKAYTVELSLANK